MQRKVVHVIAHTHWDRAWYWPFERFRVKLVECVKAVVRDLKAHPDYQFVFDGQVLMLEDYLVVCPEDRPYLQECARAGRIKIGPMYCLSDIYCTGDEALIRNLLLGQEWCRAFGGGCSRVLHMPDTFGITPCMPMIAAGFQMRAFTFMRGLAGEMPGLVDMKTIQGIEPQIPRDTRYFLWRAPDGSVIPTIRLREGYASACWLGAFEHATGEVNPARYVENLREAAAKWDTPPHPVALVMAGVDHQIPWAGQAAAQAAATASSPYEFRFSNLDLVADALATDDESRWPACENEFHGSGAASVLGGTISTRLYLKQNNARVEQLLVHQVEPAAALVRALGKDDLAIPLIAHAWKTLLVTHPHDDICGCSVDAVHRKNESDMEQAWQSADAIRRRLFFTLLQNFGANRPGDHRPAFALCNFQAVPRTGPARVQFDFEGQVEWGDIKPAANYRIVNEAGESVPFREISHGQSVEHARAVCQLELYASLRPFTVERFYLEAIADAAPEKMEAAKKLLEAANENFSVSLHANGSFDFTDHATGVMHRNLGLFSSQGDIGDSYDFSDIPSETEQVFNKVCCALTRREFPGGVIELRASGEIELPAATDSITRTRSVDRVKLPFTQTLVIAPGARELEVRLEFTNTAADHRLRWNLSLKEPDDKTLAGLKFTAIERPAGGRPEGEVAPRIFPEHPADAFVAAAGLACFSQFPVNYEVVAETAKTRRLAITVCRSVSFLTNPTQCATRPGTNAGPHTLTPEARCLGRNFRLAFALRAYAPDEAGQLLHHAALWRAQPLFGQIDATTHYPWRKETKDQPPLITADRAVIVSAFKPAVDGRGVILRLHNASATAQTVTLHQRLAAHAEPVLLDETPDASWQPETTAQGLRLTLPPFSLRTLRFSDPVAG